MDVGEKAEVTCNSRFAYGTIGLKDGESVVVPPDATIVYTIELLSAKADEDIGELNFQSRKKIG